MKAKPHICTEEEKLYIKIHYKGNNESLNQIAYDLNLNPNTIKWQLQRLGIRFRYSKSWTNEEKDKLIKLSGKYCANRISKMMHRSMNSIMMMKKVIGITFMGRDGWYTQNDICSIIGVTHKVVTRWINSNMLKASRYTGTNNKNTYWQISEDSLKLFIRTYPQELAGKNLDIIQVVDILAGISYNGNGVH